MEVTGRDGPCLHMVNPASIFYHSGPGRTEEKKKLKKKKKGACVEWFDSSKYLVSINWSYNQGQHKHVINKKLLNKKKNVTKLLATFRCD